MRNDSLTLGVPSREECNRAVEATAISLPNGSLMRIPRDAARYVAEVHYRAALEEVSASGTVSGIARALANAMRRYCDSVGTLRAILPHDLRDGSVLNNARRDGNAEPIARALAAITERNARAMLFA